MAPISTCRLSRFLTSAIASLDSFTKPARLSPDRKRLEIRVRPTCRFQSHLFRLPPASGRLRPPGRAFFRFIPVWGFLVFLLYRMRRVHCTTCGVVVEEVPWVDGKHSPHQGLHDLLGALGTQTVLEGNRRIVPHLLGGPGLPRRAVCRGMGLGIYRTLDPISAIGVDENQIKTRLPHCREPEKRRRNKCQVNSWTLH